MKKSKIKVRLSKKPIGECQLVARWDDGFPLPVTGLGNSEEPSSVLSVAQLDEAGFISASFGDRHLEALDALRDVFQKEKTPQSTWVGVDVTETETVIRDLRTIACG